MLHKNILSSTHGKRKLIVSRKQPLRLDIMEENSVIHSLIRNLTFDLRIVSFLSMILTNSSSVKKLVSCLGDNLFVEKDT